MPKLGRRSEPAGYQKVIIPSTLPPRNGPFGTDYTPLFASKIIGGKYVPVLERPYKLAGEINRSSHIEPLYPITEKPNNLDPNLLKEYSKRFPANRSYLDEPLTGIQTQVKRPDSKDINRKYPTLPPINVNRVRNMDMSTVFEPEPWTKRFKPQEEYELEASKDLFSNPPLISNQTKYEKQSDKFETVSTSQKNIKDELADSLPRSEFLPEKVIRLNDDEEWELLKVIGRELEGEDPMKLRHVYISITKNGDKQLCGWCPYKSLVYALQDYKVNLSTDTLRIAAGLFIDPDRAPQHVNYEKFLSFIGAALKNFGKSPRAGRYSPNDFTMIEEERPTYFDRKSVSPKTQLVDHLFSDREITKLLRLTEQQLNNLDYVIDFEKLISDFQLSDREFRETLSENQIKEICYSVGLPLTDSLMKQILYKCQDLNKDGQYNWIKFVYFLERVQPYKTGLYIPRGKRPLDYAKTLPHPTTEWPKPKTPRSQTPVRRNNERINEKLGYDNDDILDRDQLVQSRNEIERMDKELKELEKNYEVMKRNLNADNNSPWFKRFMELAKALYGQDISNSGLLSYDDVWNWTNLHNKACNLNIPDHVITKALAESTQSNKVNIHYFLTKIGNQNW